MKKYLMVGIALLGLVFPFACAENNPSPVQPGPGMPATNTPSGTITPGAPTNTPTPLPGAFTPTPTATFSIVPPVFLHNYGTSAAPNGMVISGSILTVAEYENRAPGPAGMVEIFSILGGGNLTIPGQTNIVLQGVPTPNSTPVWEPVTVLLKGPQGFVNPGGFGGYASILDLTGNGNAILYYGDSGYLAWGAPYNYGYFYEPLNVSGYGLGSTPFKDPKGMTADLSGNTYIADTGNACVEHYRGISPRHRWFGVAGVTFGSFVSTSFVSPYAVACDNASPANVWVGDQGYNPSVIQEFASGGTTILASWPTIPNCKVSGLAVHPTTGNIYVADSGNNLIEVYSPTGTLLTQWGDPGPAAHEFFPFSPSVIAFDASGNVYVGDNMNDFIDVFQ